MTNSRSAVFLAALALWTASWRESGTQKVLSLNRANDGQHVAATVGQPIEITMQTIGGGQYGTPQISSTAVRFEGSAFKPPREQNPGGPTQVYRFTAVAEGEAQVRIPHTAENVTFTVTIRVTKH
jgi:hypothetical protein